MSPIAAFVYVHNNYWMYVGAALKFADAKTKSTVVLFVLA